MMDNLEVLTKNPVFFERNRVFRVYRGGKLFAGFFDDPPEDGFYPEEWVASTVRAMNRNPSGKNEGISTVKGAAVLFSDLMEQHRENLVGGRGRFDVLVKLLDSSIRLPVQVHPDKAFAWRHFKSLHGKSEMWLVLATREGANVHFGFKEGVQRRDLIQAINASETDKTALPTLLNDLPAKPGDVYFISAGVAHAIGPGCLILEVQEPTDLTVQPEAWCGDYRLNDFEMYLGLPRETALECFDFTNLVGHRAVFEGRKIPRRFPGPTSAVAAESLLGYADTPDFAVNRYRVHNGSYLLTSSPAVYVVTDGNGVIERQGYSRNIRKGDYFFLPACVESLSLGTESDLEVIECLPPYRR